MARVFAVMIQSWCVRRVSRYKLGRGYKVVQFYKFEERTLAQRWRRQTVTKPESSPDAGSLLLLVAGVRV